jgi:hypothetical protein
MYDQEAFGFNKNHAFRKEILRIDKIMEIKPLTP